MNGNAIQYRRSDEATLRFCFMGHIYLRGVYGSPFLDEKYEIYAPTEIAVLIFTTLDLRTDENKIKSFIAPHNFHAI